jgi:hypothetical protein
MTVGLIGDQRHSALAVQRALLLRLGRVDAEVEALVSERGEITGDLRELRRLLSPSRKWRKRVPLPGELDAVPAGTQEVRGAELRRALAMLLAGQSSPRRIPELYRLLLAVGLRPRGRPSKAISDALRAELRRGAVVRTGRGEYLAAAKMSAWQEQNEPASSRTQPSDLMRPHSPSTAPPARMAS